MTRQEIDAAIDALIPELDAAGTVAERRPLLERIEALERRKDELNRKATDGFVKTVDEGIAALDSERTGRSADAVSALSRAARRARGRARGGGGGSGGPRTA